VVVEFVQLLRSYGALEVRGDRYAGEWPREREAKVPANKDHDNRAVHWSITSTAVYTAPVGIVRAMKGRSRSPSPALGMRPAD
jgi:hypothetical protein